ncbi:DUF4169 family protein [Paracoccus sp. MKU1]|uniref:DUF4169 family protein n=1 Tax=Paracoccus sp. MKU1 TaxID=1745182 RepID=UPI0007193373|nr:DUF4169 family protein [Paracoccus sp. MKU1]KRW96683.1 hypothetical protein AQY21_07720 [Paracoccus sp. MKU1]
MAGSGSDKVVNLRAARKSAARDAARKQGDENAAKFGRNKSQKLAEKDAAARAARHLDQHRREDPENGDE